MTKPITKDDWSKLEERSNAAVLEILQDNKAMHQSIYVDEFRQKYLPLLADPSPSKDMTPWRVFLSHPFARVHVYERDGTLLYVVPSECATLEASIPRIGNMALDGVLADRLRNSNPRKAKMEYEATLARRVKFGEKLLQNRLALNAILVKEGYQPLPPIPGIPSKLKPAQEQPGNVTSGQYTDDFQDL